MQTENKGGINYELPQVLLLQETGLGTCELAARTAYDSFSQSENHCIREFNANSKDVMGHELPRVNAIEHSDLLDNLAWTYFHHSVLEHANLTFLIKGISRGVLQEHARHRIQGITVRSTRYTMSGLINAFNADKYINRSNIEPSEWFVDTILNMNMFVTVNVDYNKLQIVDIWKKLSLQKRLYGDLQFTEATLSKEQLNWLKSDLSADLTSNDIFKMLETLKKKRNVGDLVKHVVNDNWKVDMVVTMNLRAYKNYLGLRAVGSAWFQIQWLSAEMIKATPRKYLDLIMKQDAINKHIS